MEMATSVILQHLPCEEPCEQQETRGRVIFRNESSTLTHRGSVSSSSSNSTTDGDHGNNKNHHDTNPGSDSNSLPAQLCAKFPADTTLLSRSRSMSKHHYEKQDTVMKWKALGAVVMFNRRVFLLLRARKTKVVEDGNQSANFSVNDKEHHSIRIASDVESKVSLNHKAEPSATVVASATVTAAAAVTASAAAAQMEQTTPESRGQNIFSQAMLVIMCLHDNAKAATKVIGRWVILKWLLRGLNVGSEIIQVISTVNNWQGKISNLWVTLIFSFICLVISLAEFIGEVKAKGAVWRRGAWWWWFYYPGSGTHRRLFGKFSLYFGVASSILQFVINLVTLVVKKKFVKFEYFPLLFSFGHLIAAVLYRGEDLMVECRIHGFCAVRCPQCEQDNSPLLRGIEDHQSNQLLERVSEIGRE